MRPSALLKHKNIREETIQIPPISLHLEVHILGKHSFLHHKELLALLTRTPGVNMRKFIQETLLNDGHAVCLELDLHQLSEDLPEPVVVLVLKVVEALVSRDYQ